MHWLRKNTNTTNIEYTEQKHIKQKRPEYRHSVRHNYHKAKNVTFQAVPTHQTNIDTLTHRTHDKEKLHTEIENIWLQIVKAPTL